ncbi:MAG: hypothetical protein ACOC7R_04000 [Planctomycetota bacterium]
MTPTFPQRTTRPLAIALLVLLAPAAGGCQLFSWTVASFAPRPKVPARYTFDPGERVMVFPDNPHCRLERPTVRGLLAEKVNRRLTTRRLVAETVPYPWLRMHQERMDLQHQRADGRPTPLSAMAKKASADAVLYIDIRSLRLRRTPGAPLWHGRMTARISVIGMDGQRRWPTDRVDGYPLAVELPPVSDDSSTYAMTLTEELAEAMADQVVRLFHEHRAAAPG